MITLQTNTFEEPLYMVGVGVSLNYFYDYIDTFYPLDPDSEPAAKEITMNPGYFKGKRGPNRENPCHHLKASGTLYAGGQIDVDTDPWLDFHVGLKYLPTTWYFTPGGSSSAIRYAPASITGPYAVSANGGYYENSVQWDGDDLLFSNKSGSYTYTATIVNAREQLNYFILNKFENSRAFSSSVSVYRNGRRVARITAYIVPFVTGEVVDTTPGNLTDGQIANIKANVYHQLLEIEHEPGTNWSEMANECYNSVQYFEGNGGQFIREAANIKQLIPPFSSLSNLKSPKSWGKLFLWFRYGLNLTIQDSDALIQATYRFFSEDDAGYLKTQTKYSTRILGTTRANFKVTFTPRDSASAWIKSNMMDMNLSLSNTWDMVPFSFVIDWIFNVDYYLTQYEQFSNRYAYYICNGTTQSLKTTVQLSTEGMIGIDSGELTGSLYDRTFSSGLPPLNFSTTWQPDPANHWVEAAALVVANKR